MIEENAHFIRIFRACRNENIVLYFHKSIFITIVNDKLYILLIHDEMCQK